MPILSEQYGKVLDFLRQRKRAYQLTFGNPAGNTVLTDLSVFCRANDSCYDPDPRIHALLEGRREVWLRIEKHLNYSSEELIKIFGGSIVDPQGRK